MTKAQCAHSPAILVEDGEMDMDRDELALRLYNLGYHIDPCILACLKTKQYRQAVNYVLKSKATHARHRRPCSLPYSLQRAIVDVKLRELPPPATWPALRVVWKLSEAMAAKE